MPVKLGLSAAGGVASALGGSGKAGPSISQKQVQGTSTGGGGSTTNQTQTPSLNPLMGGFQSSLVPALSDLYAKAQTPIYGQQQIAQVANQGDAATGAASQALSANLARR